MEMLNRIKSTVSSFSIVLPGNPVTREYEIIEHIASAGPGLLWKVYKGIKKSTKEEAAVFVLEKKLLDKYTKQERDCLLEIMKKGVANLTRLRHPSILTVQHPLEESRESLAFATEPVFASLANILGNQENLPVPPPKWIIDFELYDVEIKYGLYQVVEGLTFLHNDVKMLHRNICPDSIMVNKSGAWKLAGFDFSVQAVNSIGTEDHYPFIEIEMHRPLPSQPHLDYLAPEYALTLTCSAASDMFSFGALIYSVYNKGRSLLNSTAAGTSLKQQLKQLQSLQPSTFNCLPVEFRGHAKLLLNITPEVRPDAFQTSKLEMFEDIGVKTLQYLDSLYQWDNLQKSHFYKGLPQIISKMPKRVTLFRVLPCLVKEYCVPEMVPFVLPSVLLIAEDVTKEEFQQHILHDLLPLFKLQEPVQIMLIFMQKMELLLKKCSSAAINNYVLPMIYHALEADAQQIQELCLSIIPRFAGLIEYPALKNAVIPRIKKLCVGTSFLSVRVNCLVCLGKLLEHLDKWLVLDEILPFLSQIPSKEPAVLMGILGILKLTMSHKKLGITKEIMATKTIPFLMPLSIENGLTLNQFNAVMSLVKEMVFRVETEHKSKLEQLNSIRQEQSSTLSVSQIASSGDGYFDAFPQNEKNSFFSSGKVCYVPLFASSADTLLDNLTNDVFRDLGLSSFGNCDVSTKASGSVQKNSDLLLSSMFSEKEDHQKAFSLSLEEKKKLAWEQEQQQSFKSKQNIPLMPTVTSLKDTTMPATQTSGTVLPNYSFSNFCPSKPISTMTGYSTPISQCAVLHQTYGNKYVHSSQNRTILSRQNSQKFVLSGQNLDLSSLDNLLPTIGKSSQSLSQMSTNSATFPYQSLNIGCHIPWTQAHNVPNTTSVSPAQSGPQSLPIFPTPVKSPTNEIDDLLG